MSQHRKAIAERLLVGENPEAIAATLNLEFGRVGGRPAVILPGFIADDGNAEVEYAQADTAAQAAQQYAEGGDWGSPRSTIWIEVSTWRHGVRLAHGDEMAAVEVIAGEVDGSRDEHTITLHPAEPPCAGGSHDWHSPLQVVGGLATNPGVQAHGGGVIIREACAHCGTFRVTDTNAQNPETGEQGLESITYLDADDQSRAWVEARSA